VGEWGGWGRSPVQPYLPLPAYLPTCLPAYQPYLPYLPYLPNQPYLPHTAVMLRFGT
jgi:hypothetical protein